MASSPPTGAALPTTREQLLHLLTEAAELEHNLLCSYLYAGFSLKTGTDEDLTDGELAAVSRWRASLRTVCMEEMAHLAQVANLMVALGARPHFDRPNLPVAPGYHPAGIVVALAPFSDEALQHFIFLERAPQDPHRDTPPAVPDSPPAPASRALPPTARLTPHAPDYRTIGEFYARIADGLRALADHSPRPFPGGAAAQMRPEELPGQPLEVVTDLASALRAIEQVVAQGEGSGDDREDGHYARFVAMQQELRALRRRRPGFEPARPAATHPVMRAPVARGRVHVTHPAAVPLLDAFNASYALMLRAWSTLYDTPQAHADVRQAVWSVAVGAMHAMGELGTALTRLPARPGRRAPRAGPTFTLPRHTAGYLGGTPALALLQERARELMDGLATLALPAGAHLRLQRATEGWHGAAR
ncbi:ferritin-like protein [Ideonella sp.]|uniref:ferritin-like domain-containing protein n=1 Tax=Ideonella sp. TaxID=1929293 RepID=UPI0035AF93B4